MADNDTTTSEETVPQAESEKETGKGLRAQLEKTLAENRKLKAREMARSFAEIGLEPDKGLGKAIAKEYDGEISTDAILEYAKTEYAYTPPTENPDAPIAGTITTEQERLDAATRSAGSVKSPTVEEMLAKAESEGNVNESLRIKAAQLEALMYGKR